MALLITAGYGRIHEEHGDLVCSTWTQAGKREEEEHTHVAADKQGPQAAKEEEKLALAKKSRVERAAVHREKPEEKENGARPEEKRMGRRKRIQSKRKNPGKGIFRF